MEVRVSEATGSNLTERATLAEAATITPQLPFKIPQIASNRDHKAPNRGILGGVASSCSQKLALPTAGVDALTG